MSSEVEPIRDDARRRPVRNRVFLRGLDSATYGLGEHRKVLLSRERVRGADVVVDDGSVGHESQSETSRTWWRLSPGDEEFLTQTLQVHFVDLPAGASNTCHGHQNEALFYALEGAGYEVHDGARYDWQAGDLVCVHADSMHQHFNPHDVPARLLVVKAKSLWMFLGLLQQGRPRARRDWSGFGPRVDWSRLRQQEETTLMKVVPAAQTPWQSTPSGRRRQLTGPDRPDVRNHSVVLEEEDLSVGESSRPGWGMADEVVYVLHGRARVRQWQVEADLDDRYYARIAHEPLEVHVREGDLLYVPPNTVTEISNVDRAESLRLLRARNRMYDSLGYRARFPVDPMTVGSAEGA